jgi:hypothetical protein
VPPYCIGEKPYPWMKERRDVVRTFDPATMKWKVLPGVKLSQYRWYPTQVGEAVSVFLVPNAGAEKYSCRVPAM